MSYGPYGFECDLYPSIFLTVKSPPQSFAEPLTVKEMMAGYLKAPSGGSEPESLVASLIRAARADAERLQGRDLVVKQWDMVLDVWPPTRLRLATPLLSVDLVQYRDSDNVLHSLASGTDYIVDAAKSPGVLVAKGNCWPSFNPWGSSSILIRFTSGYAPEDPWWLGPGDMVKSGMRLRIADRFYDRMPKTVNGIDSAEWAMMSGAVPSIR